MGDPAEADICQPETNWLDARLIDRLDAQFNLHLSGESSLKIRVGDPYPHLTGSTPADDSNQWVLGFEDKNTSTGGADMDYNDLLFLVERLNGGMAQLDRGKAITLDEENAYYTSVEMQVCDVQPAGSCAGRTALIYFVSPDHGANWIEVPLGTTCVFSNWTRKGPYSEVMKSIRLIGHPVFRYRPVASER